VHVIPILGTFAADWSPFGTALWLSLALESLGAFFVSSFSPLPKDVRQKFLCTLPILMALGCLFTRWINTRSAGVFERWYFYKFYFAELDAAYITCVAFGAAFCIGAIRSSDIICRTVGWAFSPIFVALIAFAVWYIKGGCGLFKDGEL
jgi:hypothetical protein